MVSISRMLPYDEIVKELNKNDKIAIISCNNCVRYCGAGGLRVLDELSSKLRKDGYAVVDEILVRKACLEGYINDITVSPDVTTIITLACVAGHAAIKRIYPKQKVVLATETLGLGIYDKKRRVVKLIRPFKKYEDLRGTEYELYTGKKLSQIQIEM